MADTLTSLIAEFHALTPEIEILKRRAGHDKCDGWSMGGEPYCGRCGCGMQVEAMAALVLGDARYAQTVGSRIDQNVTDEFESSDSSARDNSEPSPTGANPVADHSAKPLVLPSEMQSKIAEEHPHG